MNPLLMELEENISIFLNESVPAGENLSSFYVLEQNNDSLLQTDPALASIGFGIPNTVLANRIVHYIYGVLLVLIGIAGATGNGLVIYVFTRYRRLREGGVPLVLSLAAGDFSVSILHILPAISSFRETWSFGKLGCELYAASVGLCGMASLLTLSVIAAERFSVIMGSPVRWLSSKKACALIWIVSLGLVFPPFVGWSQYVIEGMGTSCSWDYTSRTFRNRAYYIFLLTFGFFVPVSVIIVSYLGILHVVCKQSSRMHSLSRTGGLSKRSPSKSELKTTQVVLSIIFCFLFSWSWYAIISMIGQFGDASLLSPLSTALPAIFAKSSVIYNPFVYGLSHPLFRTAFAALKAQYFGRMNSSRGMSLNPRFPHHPHLRPMNSGSGATPNNSRKTQLVVTAKGNGSYSSRPYIKNRYHLDGQKVQLDGFKGKIPCHLLRHFTGNNNIKRDTNANSGQDVDALVHNQSVKEQNATNSSCSQMTTPSTSFRCRHNERYFKKGAWVFQRPLGPTSDSEITARTGVATHNECSISSTSDDANTKDNGTNHYKSISKWGKSKSEDRILKNSYTFFLCEYRKRRQDAIRQTFFQSETCLANDSLSSKGCKTFLKCNTWAEGAEQQATSEPTTTSLSLKNNYYLNDEDQDTKEEKLGKVDYEKSSPFRVCCSSNNKTDDNDGKDKSGAGDLVICCSDPLNAYRDYSKEKAKTETNKNDFMGDRHGAHDTIGTCSYTCNNDAQNDHGKCLNNIAENKASKDSNDSIICVENCLKENHGNSCTACREQERSARGILPKKVALASFCKSSDDVEDGICTIIESERNIKMEDAQTVRKSISLSGLKVSAHESIFPCSKVSSLKKEKTDLFAASNQVCKHNWSRDKKPESTLENNNRSAVMKNIASSFRAFELDIGKSSWHTINPSTSFSLSPSSNQLFKEENIDSCSSSGESCYESCISDFCSQNLEDLEMNSVEQYCCYHRASCELCNL